MLACERSLGAVVEVAGTGGTVVVYSWTGPQLMAAT